MTVMRGSESFLNKPADELQEFLLKIARADAAPAEARERAVRTMAAAALGVGAVSSAALGSQSVVLKSTSWLVLKWLTIGASSGFLALGVAQGIQELTTKPEAVASTPRAISFEPSLPAPSAATNRPIALEPVAIVPLAKAEFAPNPGSASAPAEAMSAPVPEPASSPRASNAPSVGVFPPPNTRVSLTHELTLIEDTRGALKRGAIPTALKLLDQYRVEFPHGSMESQADALRVQALAEESVAKDQKP